MDWLSKILNVPKLIIRIWIILWISLFILVAMKFCFNIWYPIVIENEIVLAICNFIDNHFIVKYMMSVILYLININIWVLIAIKKMKFKKKFTFIIMSIIYFLGNSLKWLDNNIGSTFELLYLILFPIIYNYKYKTFSKRIWNVLFPIIIYLLINFWQLNIFIIRDIENILTNMPTAITYALQIDYYIFLIITWIGVNYFMGVFGGGWLWSKSITELKAMKQ